MPDIRFRCPECDSKLVVDDSVGGYLVDCPICGKRITIPRTGESAAAGAPPLDSVLAGGELTQDEVTFLTSNE